MSFSKPSKPHLMTYRIARGEQGVLTYEPYKSYFLPLWRFRTVPIAHESTQALWEKFLQFYEDEDFVGMDMARKFIQIGMTRSKRYANYKGGRKYVDGKEKGNLIGKSEEHKGKEEKEEASRVFREIWERCKEHEGYARLKVEFLAEQKVWEREHVKVEDADEETKLQRKSRTKIKNEDENSDEEVKRRAKRSRVKMEND